MFRDVSVRLDNAMNITQSNTVTTEYSSSVKVMACGK